MRYATPKAMRGMLQAEARGEETELRQEKVREAIEPIMNRLASRWYRWGLLKGWLLGLATALLIWQLATS